MKIFLFFLPAFALFSLASCDQPKAENKPEVKADTLPKPKISPGTSLQITFPSIDGLIITADSYLQDDSLPWILLCHQAGYSRGEYKETAAKFEAFGYNCLAIDQRSGGEVNGIKNETAARAKEQGKPMDY